MVMWLACLDEIVVCMNRELSNIPSTNQQQAQQNIGNQASKIGVGSPDGVIIIYIIYRYAMLFFCSTTMTIDDHHDNRN